jgi:ABC-2 type transport system permease protein
MISYAYTGTSLYSPVWDIVALLVFILIFQFVANRLYKKFNE